ncbi:beta-lactamase family protein [Streptosporangium sp. NBC_01755]|uniref:serine hydrolase domain-containing protein n=1 Tax=unclassified Streptosporangium TaxID=2632669 RepID=UPI002DD9DD0D|nr:MULTISPECIES: serine hydrolase domain-containing protein [unclassified Streptosporangium]WSA28542.1 beta-lactamase family protein [Streptosporangium sp. NBC_01810]WSC99968.1 beta-lactamase family protein [Streptosporangium sp. NBC_01755]
MVLLQKASRHLLNHTSGLFLTGLAPEPQHSIATQPTHIWTTSELVKLAVSQPPVGEQGEQFIYSNGGYYLAGAIIEKVTGNAYAAEVERTVIRPLDLTHTYVRPADATGYLHPHPTTYVASALKDGVDPATLTAENWASMIDHDKPPIDVTALNTSADPRLPPAPTSAPPPPRRSCAPPYAAWKTSAAARPCPPAPPEPAGWR